jgi:hypothetical protein
MPVGPVGPSDSDMVEVGQMKLSCDGLALELPP